MWWEILKASKGLPIDDLFAALWGQKIAEDINWKITEITSTLPLTFLSNGGDLIDYRIYGTAEGAGVETESGEPTGYKLPLTVESGETENLAPPLSEWKDGYISAVGSIGSASATNKERYSPKIPVEPNATYQWAYETGQFPSGTNGTWSGLGWYDNNDSFISRNSGTVNTVLEVVAPANAVYARLSFRTYDEKYNAVFIKSSTAPDHYIPHRYTSDIPIYIGNSKLVEEEYVDYEMQKIYKVKPNLVIDTINLAFVNPSGVFVSNSQIDSAITPIQKDRVYTIKHAKIVPGSSMFCGCFENYPVKGATTYNNARFTFASDYYTFTAPIDGYLVTSVSFGKNPVVFEGEPPYLQPTDPPVPLPPIPTYKGENTLSSTEQLGEVTIKGRIKEVDS